MYSQFSRRKNRKFRIILPLVVVFILVSFFWLSRRSFSGEIISPLPQLVKKFTSPSGSTTADQYHDKNELIAQLKTIIDQEKGAYSIYIFDINKNTGFGINETTIFTAASVNKIPILAALYFDANQGKIDLDKRITIQATDIQDYGTGVIRYQGAGQVYSIKTLAQLMMEKSDNTAAYVLANTVREKRIQELVESWGMNQTNIDENKTSNKDMALLLIKMFQGEIADKAHTTEMLGFMDDSDFENRIPALLPDSVTIYHKIGNEVGNIHDVGIVADPKTPYYIGVLTNDITDDATTEKLIAKISQVVYQFMTGK